MAARFPEEFPTMNDLPNELLLLIFKHLKIRDVIRCSLVCQRFSLLCQDVKMPELIITDKLEYAKDRWFFTKKPFNHQDAIDVTTFNYYLPNFRFESCKRLYFIGSLAEYNQLNLNRFTRLEQLKIGVAGDGSASHIELPHLKIMELDYDSTNVTFVVTSPALEMLKCRDYDIYHLTCLNNIEYMVLKYYREISYVRNNIQYFRVDRSLNLTEHWSNVCRVLPNTPNVVTHQIDVGTKMRRSDHSDDMVD